MLSRCLRALLFVPTVATALHAQSSKITTYVRYAVDGQTSYGRVVGTTVQQLRAAPWLDSTRTGRTTPLARVKLLAPATPSKVIAVGLNYQTHLGERSAATYPGLFAKFPTSIIAHDENIVLPSDANNAHYEGEMVIVIGKQASNVTVADAKQYVFGITVGNDVSEREYQLERGGTWDKGKGCDTFGPVGPWLVTTDEIKNPQKLGMWLDVNGKRFQTGTTKTMIFDVQTIVSYVSEFMTLMPGDIITTGTPPGVGMGVKPKPRYLKAGDVMTLGIDGLGEQRQEVVAFKK